ncbi:DUF503 domain-containing protein [Candidatus Sumerlaeota bacterium]|nr:DUF503 domain-containing protein [Candidatus Sumerlaeota bacterium]
MPHSRRTEEPSTGHAFTIGVLELDLHLPLCHSLKAKRGILARVMNQLRKHFPVTVAEVGDHDVWGRAGLAAVTISGDPSVAESILNDAARSIERSREVELIHFEIELI